MLGRIINLAATCMTSGTIRYLPPIFHSYEKHYDHEDNDKGKKLVKISL
jgi:hypothetical protein